MLSIRQRLTLPIVGGLLLLSLAACAAGYGYVRHILHREFDSELEAKARAISTLVEVEEGREIRLEFSDANMPEFVARKSPQYYQIWLNDGSVLARSKSLKRHDLPYGEKGDRDHRSVNFRLPDGRAARGVVLRFHPVLEEDERRTHPPDVTIPKATIMVARERADLDQTLNLLLIVSIAACILLPLLAGLIVYLGVQWGLRPLHGLARAITRVESPSVYNELPVHAMPAELTPIAAQLNAMMKRLKAAFDRERQFTMDASHELRTPLAETRTALEVALKWPDDHRLMTDSCKDALEATRNMEGLVAALLSLARSESGLVEPSLEPLDLAEMFIHSWNRLAGVAARRKITLQQTAPDGKVMVTGDRSLLGAVLTNLIENALEYSRENTIIRAVIATDAAGLQPRLTVTNTTAQPLTPDDLTHVFEPLWRKEESRTMHEADSTEKVHTGLGLPLVRSFCHLMNVQVRVSLAGPDQFQVVLQFP